MSQILKRYTKQIVVILFLILSTVVFASYVVNYQLNESLNSIYLKKLNSLKNSMKVSVEKYFVEKQNIIQTISKTSDVKNAMIEFKKAFSYASKEYPSEVETQKMLGFIKKHTDRVFYNIPNSPKKKPLKDYVANTSSGKILQNLYVVNNPFESANRKMFFNSNANISYDKVHKKHHKKFVDILKRHNFYDVFLIDKGGNIVYSVYKEIDFATNLTNGIYKQSPLALVYKKTIQTKKIEFTDYKPYEPSYNKPASFFSAPIIKEGEFLGVIAFQVSIKEVDNIMTFDESWEKIGLGETGEAYLVGDDYYMKSNSRFIDETGSDLVNNLYTTVGVVKIKTNAIEDALSGKESYGTFKDYRGTYVLGSYIPIKILDKSFALAVEVDQKEINSEIQNTVKTVLSTGIVLVVLFIILLIYILLRLIIRPLENFERSLDSKVKEKTKDLEKSTAILNDYKKAIDKSSIVSKTDPKGIIKYVNKEFCAISGYEEDELIGKPHNIVRHPDTPKSFFEDIWRTIRNKRVWKGIIKNKTKDGGDYIVKSTIVPIVDEKGIITEFISIRTDISELISKEKKVIEQSTDELTKLPNRIKLIEDIASTELELKLAIIQVDRFKEINDFYGFEKGDLLLINLTSIIQRTILDNNIKIYKVGSGEFAALCDDKISMEHFVKLLQNTIKYCDHNVIGVGSDSFNISITVGISRGNRSKIFFNAEMALRKAIENSKSLLAFENADDIEKEYENNIVMTKKIKEAIKDDNILVYAQPIKANSASKKSKYECLVRMKDGEKVLSPFFFLDIAKKARLYPTLTKIIIEKSFEHFENRKDEFSINLSIEDILSDDIVLFLKKKIDYYKIGHRVVLELVESEGIENFDDVLEFIKEFKGYGCKVAIDDFGTGYSNFEYLMKLDVDYVKIDGSLIKNIDTDKNSELIVELIVDFAKRMKIQTIAEFIHNEAIYKKIKSMGIDYSQGYYLGEPKDLDHSS